MKLNLGCADLYVAGWHNVDLHVPAFVDERVDLTGPLPWAPGTFTDVYAGHILEHLALDDARTLLGRLRMCVDPLGMILVVGPDVTRAERMITDGTFTTCDHTLDSIKYGDDRWEGTRHQWQCTTETVVDLLNQAGWWNVTDVGIGNVGESWPVVDRTQMWQCAVSGRA